MAAKSSNGAGCAANGAPGVDWRSIAGLSGWSHRRRRSRHRTGRIVRHGQVDRVNVRASLGARTKSLSAVDSRRPGGNGGHDGIRSASRRGLALVSIRGVCGQSAATAAGASSLDCAATVRPRASASRAVRLAGPARLRSVHATDRRALHAPLDVRGVGRIEWPRDSISVSGRRVSAAPGEADRRRRGRRGSRSTDAHRLSYGIRAGEAGIDGSNGSGLRAHVGRSCVPPTTVQLPATQRAALPQGS